MSAELRHGYKQTEVGVIPEDWNVVLLSAIAPEIGDGIHATPVYSPNGDYFFINGNNIRDGRIIVTEDTKLVDNSEFKKHQKNLGEGTILLSINGTIGNLGLYAEEMIMLGKSAAYLNVKNEVGKKYVYYYLQTASVRRQFNDGLTGTTIRNLGLATIRNTQIAIPPTKAEQESIAEALSDADALIESLEQLITKKRHLKQGAMQELLTGKKRLRGFNGEWVVSSLPDIIWYQEGPGLRNWQFKPNGLKVINVTNLQENGYLDLSKTERHISLDEFERLYKHFLIDDGDVVIASSGNSYCKTAVVRQNDLPLLMNTSVIRFKAKQGIIRSYMLIYLKSKYFKDQIDLMITGGAQPNFGPAHLSKVIVPLPPTEAEQNAIATILSDLDTEIAALETQLAKTRSLKQGMMHNLLTGRIRLL